MDAATAGEGAHACPQCGARLQADAGFTVWCDRCDWNVEPYPPATVGLSRFDRLEQQLARRYTERLFAEITKGVPLRPHRDVSSVLAQGLAVIVHASTVALVGVGLWFVFGGLGFVAVFVGVLLLAIAVLLRPRFARLPEHESLLERRDAPELFGLADEVAAAAGTRGADRIAVDGEFNASVTVYGVGGHRLLTIGLPLWEILSPEQRVALLAHEFGHFSNGDPRHGGLVHSAIRSLSAWCYLLAPDEYDGNPLMIVVTVITFLPYVTVLGLLLLMYRVTLRSSQRGEYLADRLGARVGGTAAAVGLQDRTLLESFVERAIVRVRARQKSLARDGLAPAPQPEDLWDRVAEEVAAVPEHELERLRRAGAKRDQSVDSTHPPTHLRREVLALAPPVPPEVMVDAARAIRIEAEFAILRRTLATQEAVPTEG
jgi:Zn-dependent protease with chaperone function